MQAVKYTGTDDVRTIGPEDWESLGIDELHVTWSRENGFLIPVEQLSAEAVEWLETQPEEFEVGDFEEPEVEETVALPDDVLPTDVENAANVEVGDDA